VVVGWCFLLRRGFDGVPFISSESTTTTVGCPMQQRQK